MHNTEPTSWKVPCENCPLRGKPLFREFSEKEFQFVKEFKAGELTVEAGATVLLEGTISTHLYTVLSGWTFRYKMLPTGRRQILNFALPGDLVGVQGALFDKMEHSVEALTNSILCIFPRDKFSSLFSNFPRLSFDVTWLCAREERILDENLLTVGRRTALEGAAYLLLHLFRRAEDLGLTDGDKIQFPFFQQHVADALGMSLVHTNNTLRKLSEMKVMRWKNRVFHVLSRKRLAEIAQYDLTEKPPRPFI
jgi:CRP/FNR family transcriptional regulator, anaerobic regulatory protein